ncbi:hypothetical protein LX36DRAFT_140465 [Colletotrichum falcatum]|nr:hypothetical protein LX36DRAFT_140465 [Colletotrichum falcatum]
MRWRKTRAVLSCISFVPGFSLESSREPSPATCGSHWLVYCQMRACLMPVFGRGILTEMEQTDHTGYADAHGLKGRRLTRRRHDERRWRRQGKSRQSRQGRVNPAARRSRPHESAVLIGSEAEMSCCRCQKPSERGLTPVQLCT